jgi:hypothetical protein
VDLTAEFGRAEARPAGARFEVGWYALDGTNRLSVQVPVPSRAIWTTTLPQRATLSAFVGLVPSETPCTARFRIGISDNRIYEALAAHTAAAAGTWTEMRVDLSLYAGRKFSIFYQPDGTSWRLVLSADQGAGTPCTGLWGEPAVETDNDAARQFSERRAGGIR